MASTKPIINLKEEALRDAHVHCTKCGAFLGRYPNHDKTHKCEKVT